MPKYKNNSWLGKLNKSNKTSSWNSNNKLGIYNFDYLADAEELEYLKSLKDPKDVIKYIKKREEECFLDNL